MIRLQKPERHDLKIQFLPCIRVEMCPTCVELWIMSEIAFQSKNHYQRMQETLLSSNFGQKILSCQTVSYGTLASMDDFKTKYYTENDP